MAAAAGTPSGDASPGGGRLTLSPGGVVPVSDAPASTGVFGLGGVGSFGGGGGGGLTERMLAARAVAGVLGVLSFGSGAAGAGIAAGSLAPPPGVDAMVGPGRSCSPRHRWP